jgi:hypothetical protein
MAPAHAAAILAGQRGEPFRAAHRGEAGGYGVRLDAGEPGRLPARAQFLTDDGEVIFMHYTGLVQQT